MSTARSSTSSTGNQSLGYYYKRRRSSPSTFDDASSSILARSTPTPTTGHTIGSSAISASCTLSRRTNNHDDHLNNVLSSFPLLTFEDKVWVYGSSLVIFTSVIWVPYGCYKLYRYWKSLPTYTDQQRCKRRRIGYLLLLLVTMLLTGYPHRTQWFGRMIKVRQWRLWKSWCKYVAFEVIMDEFYSSTSKFNIQREQAIFAIIPHGIFPLPLALAALPQQATQYFGTFRPVVATATALFPFVRSFLGHVHAVDATKSQVDGALRKGHRIGVSPGGIAEMFVPLNEPNQEYILLHRRKGFVRMAMKHQLPIIPIYVFGGSTIFQRLPLPKIFEYISKLLKISLCVFFGKWNLPIPLRTKLLYVVGKPLIPPIEQHSSESTTTDLIDDMHHQFCTSITNLFNQYKHRYGWSNKTLTII